MEQIVTWNLFNLKPHPKNTDVFGDPRLIAEYPEIKESIRKKGLQEPIIIKPDGTILSGHLRYHVLMELASERGEYSHDVGVPVRIKSDLHTDAMELEYLFEANIERRQLSPRQIAAAFTALLCSAPPDEPILKSKGGRPRKDDQFDIHHERRASTKERVARILHVSTRTADAVAIIYQTAGVPADILEMVDTRVIAVQTASDAVKFAITEAFRKNPDLDAIVVDPIDVRTFVDATPLVRRLKMSDLIRGFKLPKQLPVMLDGEPVTKAHSPIHLTQPPPFTPKQKVGSMIRKGVEWSKGDYSDHGLPLHEALQRIRVRLGEAFDNSMLIREDKVEPLLDAILEKIAHFIRTTTGEEVTIHIGGKRGDRSLPENLSERLLMLRLCLDETDPDIDQDVLRKTFLDIATTARDRANSLRKVVNPKEPVKRPQAAPKTFSTNIEYILQVLGEDTINSLSP